jgi:hypothetical protein
MSSNLGKFLSAVILIAMLTVNGLACHKKTRRTNYRTGYVPVSQRYNSRANYYRDGEYRSRRNHSTRNAILQVAVPAAAGLGVGALIGGRTGAGVGALVGGGGGLAYHLLKSRRR